MRKLYFLAVICLLAITITHAQIRKGSTFLGGDISASTQKSQTGTDPVLRQSGFTISPVFGKAIKDNLVLGGDLSYGHSKYDNVGSEQKINVYGAGIFLRKYKPLGSSGFFIFLQGRAGYRYLESTIDTWTTAYDQVKNHTINISAYPGLSYAISRKLHLETGFNNVVSVNYFTEKREIAGGTVTTVKNSGFSISSSLNNISNLYLGFRVLLGK